MKVGDSILYRVSDKPDGIRPGIVVCVWTETCLNAVVFLDGMNDHPAVDNLCCERSILWATSITRGNGLSEWQPASIQGELSGASRKRG